MKSKFRLFALLLAAALALVPLAGCSHEEKPPPLTDAEKEMQKQRRADH